jgi:CO/xanthine dehydrogenase Mo-binding subunit
VAANKVRQKALAVASEMMQTPVDQLDVVDGVIERTGIGASPSMSLAEVAAVLGPTSRSLGDREPGLSSEGWFFTEHMVFPYGVHVAVVQIDLDTGGITVDRYLVGYDVGRAVNPAMIEGQIAGGMAQGIGGALLEEFCYDEGGQPVSVTFADYLLPTAREIPPLQLLLTEDAPSPCNPLGLKGAGEGGSNGAGAAIAAAIDNALGIPLAVTELPVTPQRLRALLKRSRKVCKVAPSRAEPMEIEV